MRYEKPTVQNVAAALKATEIVGQKLTGFSVFRRPRGEGDVFIDLPRGMRTPSMRRYIRANVLVPTFGKRYAETIRFERHSWWENL